MAKLSNTFEMKLSRRDSELFYDEFYSDLRITNNTNPKVNTPMANSAKKYRASVSVFSNDYERGSTTVQVLLTVDVSSDTFADLIAQAHGHLELAKDN